MNFIKAHFDVPVAGLSGAGAAEAVKFGAEYFGRSVIALSAGQTALLGAVSAAAGRAINQLVNHFVGSKLPQNNSVRVGIENAITVGTGVAGAFALGVALKTGLVVGLVGVVANAIVNTKAVQNLIKFEAKPADSSNKAKPADSSNSDSSLELPLRDQPVAPPSGSSSSSDD